MKQYPYTLWIKTVSEATKNNQGNLIASEPNWMPISACRDESNSKGQSVQLPDQSLLVFDSLIQLPLSCPDVETNTSIQVRDGSGIRLEGIAKRFQRDQLHCRLWV